MRTFVWSTAPVTLAELTDGLAQIYNTGEGKVEVTEVSAEPVAGTVNGTQPGSYALVRITSLTVGNGTVIGSTPADTSASPLPGQVQFVEMPDDATQSDTLRQVADCPTLSSTLGLGAFGALLPVCLGSSSSHFRMRSGRAGGDVESIILRAGEGLAYVQTAAGLPHGGNVTFRIRVVGTSRSYTFRGRNVGTVAPGRVLCALMNGVGSGVVLEVNAVSEVEDGTATLPTLRLALTDGYYEVYGSPTFGTPIPMDPQSAYSLPSTVNLVQGPFLARLSGEPRGVPYEWHRTHGTGGFSLALQQQAASLRALTRVPRPNTPNNATMLTHYTGSELFKAPVGSGIVLGCGEGLSVLRGRAGVIETSSYLYYSIRFVFTYKPRAKLNPLRGTLVSAT